MKIIVTGSLGPISRPLALKLIEQGNEVTIISRSADKVNEIQAIGAFAAIGSLDDVDFLTHAFTGADAAYLMEPTVDMFDHGIDILTHYGKICERYAKAVLRSGLKRIVHLSSIGGHSDSGNGLLAFHYYAEKELSKLPDNIAITTLRPMSFYSNIMAFMKTIKENKAIITSYKAVDPEPWSSPYDIAEAAADELVGCSNGRKVTYVISDEVTSERLVSVLGQAIGEKIDWIMVPHQDLEKSYREFGMSPAAAKGFAELNEAKNSGALYDDLRKNRDKVIVGKVKIEHYADDFAEEYKKPQNL